MVCHYRHRRHADPFVHVGLQDITASVDFTQVAESAAASGLTVAGFATQAGFLIGAGLDEVIAADDAGGGVESWRRSREAGQLILPGQMGEHFKAMALTRNVGAALKAFSFQNHVHRL
jgi:SAM-dependent MidA family methyltransferase